MNPINTSIFCVTQTNRDVNNPPPFALDSLTEKFISATSIPNTSSSSLKRSHTVSKGNVRKKRKIDKNREIKYCTSFFKKPTKFSLLKDLASLFNNKNNYNVILNIESESLYVHREILALRSPMLKTMLLGSFKEGIETERQDATVKIAPSTRKDIFEDVIFFIYTGQISITLENVCFIYLEADYLQIDELKKLCKNFFVKSLTNESIFSLWETAYYIEDLCEEARSFYFSNQSNVVSFPSLLPEELLPEIYNEILLSNQSPINLDEAGVWGQNPSRTNPWLESKCRETVFNVLPCGDEEAVVFWKIKTPVLNEEFKQSFQLGGHTYEFTLSYNSFIQFLNDPLFEYRTGGKRKTTLLLTTPSCSIFEDICTLNAQIISVFACEQEYTDYLADIRIDVVQQSIDEEGAAIQIYSHPKHNLESIILQIKINIDFKNSNNPLPTTFSCAEQLIVSLNDLHNQFIKKKHDRIHLELEDQEIYVPRWFLKQRAPQFFEKMTALNVLPEVSVETFQFFLSFICTGKLKIEHIDQGRKVCLFAKKFNLKELENFINNDCLKWIDLKNAVSLYRSVDKKHEKYLFDGLFSFIARNARKLFIKGNIDFLSLTEEEFFLFLKSDDLNLTEKEIVITTTLWLENQTNSENALNRAKEFIRYSHINLFDFWSVISDIKVNDLNFYSLMERVTICDLIGNDQKIHPNRSLEYPWLLGETEKIFDCQKNVTQERQTVIYWKIPMPVHGGEEWSQEQTFDSKNDHFELGFEFNESFAFFLENLKGFGSSTIQGVFVAEDDKNNYLCFNKTFEKDKENSFQIEFEISELQNLCYNGYLHFQLNLIE